MKLTNDSGFPATLARAQLLYRDLMLATVVVKASFQVAEDGGVTRVDTEEQLAVSEADVTTDLGTIDGDVVPIKPGCDLALLGHARSPHAERAVDRLLVDLRVGTFSRPVTVFGDRNWTDSSRSPKMTAPAPFTAIPLTYDRSYGGSAVAAAKLVTPYSQNPDGSGYVRLREHVAGTRLPNLEESDQLISSWEQTPLAAGTAPLPRVSSLRLDGGGFAVDIEKEMVQLTPPAFSFAHPRMKLARYPGGETLTVTSVTVGGPWTFTLPVMHFTVAICLGSIRYELPLVVDTLCLFPDYRRFFILARRACVYQLLPERLRTITVFSGEATAGTATTNIAEQRRAMAPIVPILPAAAPEALPLSFDSLLELYPLTSILETLPLCPSD